MEACLQHPCVHWELRPTGFCQPRLLAFGAFHWLDNNAARPCHMHVATCEFVKNEVHLCTYNGLRFASAALW